MKKIKSLILKIIIIGTIILIALGLRVWNLEKPDITADEFHYISESRRLLDKDPYISIRHHAFKHAKPNMGHPFLAQVIGAIVFKLTGRSIFTARLPSVLFAILTLFLLFFFNKKLGGKTVIISVLLFAVLPFAVRFNRDAHLDTLLTFWTTLVALSIWRYDQRQNIFWLILSGIAGGLAISTKLNGVIALILAIFLLRVINKVTVKKLFYLLIPAVLVSLLLNDPMSYVDGIINPSDPAYKVQIFAFLLGLLRSVGFWFKVFFLLVSPVIFIFWFFSLFILLRDNNKVSKFLITWQLVLFSLFFFHRPGVSGEYGLLPLLPPLIMSFVLGLEKFKKNIRIFIFIFVIISVLPFTYWYGLRAKSVTYYEKANSFNRTIKDDFYQTVLKEVNKISPNKAKVYLLPTHEYPYFILRSDLSWGYSGDPYQYDVLVVDDKIALNLAKDKIIPIKKLTGDQDGEKMVRLIYFLKKENEQI